MFSRALMRSLLLTITLFIAAGMYFAGISYSGDQSHASVKGIFQGITPCSGTDRPLPQIPAGTDCEQMIWEITFYWNAETAEPSTYLLHAAYGFSQPNTTGLKGDGTPIDLEGEWRVTEGSAVDAAAIVYELNPDTPEATIYFVRLDDNLLHVMSPEKRLMVGNPAWSYTLNRTDKPDKTSTEDSSPAPQQPSDETSTPGVFEGRMPCADEVVEFTEFPADPDCIKIKMRLTLYRDAETGETTTYFLKGTETTREGLWTEVRGNPAHPNGIVYRMSLDAPERFIDFLRIDDNHLFLLDENQQLMVGDALWSYTLSRNPELSAKMQPIPIK